MDHMHGSSALDVEPDDAPSLKTALAAVLAMAIVVVAALGLVGFAHLIGVMP